MQFFISILTFILLMQETSIHAFESIQQDAPPCDIRRLIDQKNGTPAMSVCDKLKKIQPYDDSKPFEEYLERYNKTFDIESYSLPSQNKTTVTKDLLSDIKKHFRNLILKGRSPSELSKEEQTLISRINLVDVEVEKETSIPKPLSCMGSPAIFDFKIYVCDSWLTNKAEVSFLLGHELGHALNSCAASDSIMEKIGEGPISLERRQETEDIFRSLKEVSSDMTAIEEAKMNAQYHKSLYGAKFWSGQYVSNNPENAQFFRPYIDAIPLSKYPLADVRDCLIRQGVPSNIEASSKIIRGEEVKVDPVILDKLSSKNISVECDSNLNNKMVESSADWFGSQALSHYLFKNRKTKTNVAEIARMWIGNLCNTKDLSSVERSSEPHLNPIARYNKIIFSTTCVQKALGCKPISDNLIFCGDARLNPKESHCNIVEPNQYNTPRSLSPLRSNQSAQ